MEYGVDEVIPQFHIKWFTKLSFVLKITQFLVCEPFFFYHRFLMVNSIQSYRNIKDEIMLLALSLLASSIP